MRCPVCNFHTGTTYDPPKDIKGNDIFLWDQVYLSDSDDDDTEAYVIEILSGVAIRVLIPVGRDGQWVDVWDVPSDSAHKLNDHSIEYGSFLRKLGVQE